MTPWLSVCDRSLYDALAVCVCDRLLKEAADDLAYRKRYQLMFGALLSVVGEAGRREFSKEEDLVKILSAISQKVKAAKDKEVRLAEQYMCTLTTHCNTVIVVAHLRVDEVWRT